jgi:hypothetical protein
MKPIWELAKDNASPSTEIKPVLELPEVERRMHTEDGERVWVVARGSIGRSAEGFHARVDVFHDYDEVNDLGFWGNPRIERVTVEGIPDGWSAALPSQEDASRAVKKTLVEFDRGVAEFLEYDRVLPSGTASYAAVNWALAWPEAVEAEIKARETAKDKEPELER